MSLSRRTPLRSMSDRAKRVALKRAELRRTLLEQRGPRCEAPGCDARWTDMHERLKRSRGGDPLDPANIVCLCRRCHEWTERHPAAATEAGLLTPSWQMRSWSENGKEDQSGDTRRDESSE